MLKEFLDSLNILDKADFVRERAKELTTKADLSYNEAFIIANKELENGTLWVS